MTNLHTPYRLAGETFESYKLRRTESQLAVKEYIDNPPKSDMRWMKVKVGPYSFKTISLNRLDKRSARYERH